MENKKWVAKTRNKHRLQKKGTRIKAHKTDGKQRQRENKEGKQRLVSVITVCYYWVPDVFNITYYMF